MNWQILISDLEHSGMTRAEIARSIPCSAPQITDLAKGKRGKSLDYKIADKLRELHKQRCGVKPQEAA